jgi:hypothetical protein
LSCRLSHVNRLLTLGPERQYDVRQLTSPSVRNFSTQIFIASRW